MKKPYPEDHISLRKDSGEIINGGAYFIIHLIRMILLLITFPIRALIYILNPFAPKNIRIKK